MTTLHAVIIAAGIALAGLLIAISMPSQAEPIQLPVSAMVETPEPRFHTVWIPGLLQLTAINELGIFPSCADLENYIAQNIEGLVNHPTVLLEMRTATWTSLECRE